MLGSADAQHTCSKVETKEQQKLRTIGELQC